MAQITVRYFAAAAEAAGVGEEPWDLGPSPTLGELRQRLSARYGAAMDRVLRTGSFLVDGVVRRDDGPVFESAATAVTEETGPENSAPVRCTIDVLPPVRRRMSQVENGGLEAAGTGAGGTGAASTGASGIADARGARRSVEDHRAAVGALLGRAASAIDARPAERIAILHPALVGRITAAPLRSRVPLPPFDNSQMDGYAVRSADLAGADAEHPAELAIGVTTAAGDARATHAAGTASPVMTGAPIPEGADAVIPIEEALPPRFTLLRRAGRGAPGAGDGAGSDDGAGSGADADAGSEPSAESGASVRFTAAPDPGRFVRRRGSDLPAGAEILPAGVRLSPARIGALAAAGITEVAVRPRIRVLLCATGDELVPGDGAASAGAAEGAAGPGAAGPNSADPNPAGPVPARIHDANTPMLAAALRSAGAEVLTLRVADQPDALRRAIAERAPEADLLVTTGGISEGAFEVVREAFAPLGVDFVKIAMQPGGPQGLGPLRLGSDLPALCFPGNPVSAMLSAELFLLPFLRERAGLPAERPRALRPVAHDADSPIDKLQLRRGTLAADGRVVLSGPGSHLLAGLAAADVIAEIPVGVSRVAENTPLTVWSIND